MPKAIAMGRLARVGPAGPNCRGIESFRLLGQACFGVVIGVLLALVIVRLTLPPQGPAAAIPDGLLPWNLHNVWLKPREKAFYILSLLIGATCGYFATCRFVNRWPWSCFIWVVVILSVFFGNTIIDLTLADGSPTLPLFVALGGAALFLFIIVKGGRPPTGVADFSSEGRADRRRWPYLLLLLLLTLMLIPSSFQAVAAMIGLNFHPVSFVFGPALYFLGDGLLPGIDYYSQYSIGFPWLFHYVMGSTPEKAVVTYTMIVIGVTWIFYAHLIYILRWLYRSWVAAGLVAIMPFVLGFCYPDAWHAFFFAPSSSILRYPLLTLCAKLVGIWVEIPTKPQRLLTIAAATAAAIFLEFETGIIMLVAAVFSIFIVYPWRISIILPICGFLAATVLWLLLVLLAVFGAGAFQTEFFLRLFEGVRLYGMSGFGAAPMVWTLTEWNWLYHLVAPGASLATIAVIARASGRGGIDRQRAAVLGFLAISGLMLLAKFANQSVAAVWQMSAIGPLCVLGWWAVALLRHIDPGALAHTRHDAEVSRPPGVAVLRRASARANLYRVAASAMVLLALAFIASPSEARNPGRYGLRAWMTYPSLLGRPFGPKQPGACRNMNCVPNRPAASDVALIQSRTKPGEQVAIVVDLYDWTYLLAAHRAPLMFFVPSAVIFTTRQLDESLLRLKNQQYLFVPKGLHGEPYYIEHDDVRAAIGPLLGTVYEKDGEGERLVAWKRVAPGKGASREP